jgi:hypothetical protein
MLGIELALDSGDSLDHWDLHWDPYEKRKLEHRDSSVAWMEANWSRGQQVEGWGGIAFYVEAERHWSERKSARFSTRRIVRTSEQKLWRNLYIETVGRLGLEMRGISERQ